MDNLTPVPERDEKPSSEAGTAIAKSDKTANEVCTTHKSAPHIPRTVEAGFDEFSAGIVPQYSETAESASILHRIEQALSRNYSLDFMAPYGSCGHGTNIRNQSATDSFAVIQKSELFEDPGKTLEKVADILNDEVGNATVTGGRPVVAVVFGEKPSDRHHIVPAFSAGSVQDHDIFQIPAPSNRWIGISPAAHSVWINRLDEELNNSLKPFIRVIKAWSYFNNRPIWSHYLELCAADFLRHDHKILFSRDLTRFFNYLRERNLAPFEDSAGCIEAVYGTSKADRDAAISTIKQACEYAEKAIACEAQNNVADAFYWWRKIFDWNFAAY